MRKLAILILFTVLFISILPSCNAEPRFIIVKIYPDEFQVLDESTIQITVKNVGNSSAFYVTAEILTKELEEKKIPIKILDISKKCIGQTNFGSIGRDEKATVQYKIYIDKSAESTVYNIPLKISWNRDYAMGGEEENDTLYFGIKVTKKEEAQVELEKISTHPEILMPREKGTIEITLKNVGGTTIRTLNVNLIPVSPIKPSTSDLEMSYSQIEPSESVTAVFDIAVEDSVPENVFYDLPLILKYEDDFGLHTKNTSVGVEIRGEPNVLIHEIILEPNRLTTDPNLEGMFMITLINVGTEYAEDVKIKICGGEEILTEEHQFIGEIAPGESQTTTFGVSVDENIETGKHGLKLDISYKDRFGKSYLTTKMYILSVFPAEPFIPANYVYIMTAFIIFLILGYVALMLWKIGREKKKTGGQS